MRSVLQRAPVTCAREHTLAEVAALMREEGVGSVVVADADGLPIGIVTSHDMVGVVAEDTRVRTVEAAMSRDPVMLSANAFAYEAAVTMLARRIRHVLVMDEGRLAGVVSERDLFSLQRLGLGEITMELRLAGSIPVLTGLAAEVRKLARRLVAQGVAPEQLTLFVSVLNDRLSQRAIEIVRKRHDLERISWSWLAFGSEGRFEQTLATDQDNGLIFEAHDNATPVQVRARLLPFAHDVNQALDACGFPLCKGNVMASNAELCLSLDEWRAKMKGWIEVSMPKALLDAAICFDFRPLYGDAPLVGALRDWVGDRIKSHPAFLRHMADSALRARAALNRFGGFATEDVPDAPDSVNLKTNGARIFVDAARIYALAKGLPQTNTVERLRAALGGTGADLASTVEAFYLIQRLRLVAQLQLPETGNAAVNRIAPARLDRVTQAALKEALRVAKELQDRLALDYQL
ncbi:MAG: hypothetical protein A3I63_08515 [Betaproteobacteria bacterium RIFCSPLOWO2_02_FULL_66_14]|nr:MAG: hypothetical protein A3I63_08515 [Betaproteobacteria bacterium RIFCSPLOWO2_02_FULL_66_14]